MSKPAPEFPPAPQGKSAQNRAATALPAEAAAQPGALSTLMEGPNAPSVLAALERHRADQSQPMPPLVGAQLVGQDLRGLSFAGLDLSGADLSRCRLDNCIFLGANLQGATFYETQAEHAEFGSANLAGANFRRARLEGVSLGQANLTDARFDDAILTDASLVSAQAVGASFELAKMRGVRLNGANLTSASFSKADLHSATFDGATVTKASFVDADMRASSLRQLNGSTSADWIGVDLRDVDFTGAYLLRRQVRDQNYLFEFRQQSKAHEALYWVWWLTSDCGRSMLRWGVFVATLVMLFAGAYLLVDVNYGAHESFLSPVYFSLVTMTTLGYGDVLPNSTAAQFVTMLEVSTGYLMLGGLVSILSSKLARRAD